MNDIHLVSHTHRILLDEDENTEHTNDWLSPPELDEKSRRELRSKKIRESFNPSTTAQIPPNDTDKSMILSNKYLVLVILPMFLSILSLLILQM